MINKIIRYVVCIILIIMVIASSLQVLFRYIFQHPLAWSEELTRYLMVWLTLLGAGIAFFYERHLGIDFLFIHLSKKGQTILKILNNFIIGSFLILIIVKGFDISYKNFSQMSPAMRIPIGWIYLSIPIGSIIMLFVCCNNILTAFKALGQK